MTHVATGETTLQVALLGPPQILWRGEPFRVARRQVRGLLFYLAHAPAPARESTNNGMAVALGWLTAAICRALAAGHG